MSPVPKLEPVVLEDEAAVAVAGVDRLVRHLLAVDRERPATLVFATGRTYVPFYEELARRQAAEVSSALGRSRGYNLDELVLPRQHPASFAAYMERHVWSCTALDPSRFAIPDVEPALAVHGAARQAALAAECRRYDGIVARHEPADVCLLGLGADGHLAYNLPGPPREGTHVVTLGDALADELEAPAQARPLQALTVGFAALRSARRLLLLVTGESKAEALRHLVEGPEDPAWPCTLVRQHPGLEVLADRQAMGS